MAQPANLKKMTRERMERTGESYTTARKNIMAGKPESPRAARAAAARNGGAGKQYGKSYAKPHAKSSGKAQSKPAPQPAEEELPEYPAPNDVMQYDAALWHRVFTQAGVVHPLTRQPLSEALLAGLAGGIGFMSFTHADDGAVQITAATRPVTEPWTQNLLTRSGTKVLERTTNSGVRAEEYLNAGLDAGRAVVVRVAVAALPWIDAESVDEDDVIDLAVVGEHEDANLLVDDGSGVLNLISPAELSAARAARKKEKHWQAWVPSKRSPRPDALAASVREAIAGTTAHLLGTDASLPVHLARNFGIAGMRTLAARLADTESKTGWGQLLAEAPVRAAALEQFAGFLTDTRFGAPGGLRGLYAEFLAEASELPGLSALGAHVAAYNDLAEAWDEFTGLVDPQVSDASLRPMLDELSAKQLVLAEAEQQAAQDLAAAL